MVITEMHKIQLALLRLKKSIHSLKQIYIGVYKTWDWGEICMFFDRLDTPTSFMSVSVPI